VVPAQAAPTLATKPMAATANAQKRRRHSERIRAPRRNAASLRSAESFMAIAGQPHIVPLTSNVTILC
jgi:hypothetical protein